MCATYICVHMYAQVCICIYMFVYVSIFDFDLQTCDFISNIPEENTKVN